MEGGRDFVARPTEPRSGDPHSPLASDPIAPIATTGPGGPCARKGRDGARKDGKVATAQRDGHLRGPGVPSINAIICSRGPHGAGGAVARNAVARRVRLPPPDPAREGEGRPTVPILGCGASSAISPAAAATSGCKGCRRLGSPTRSPIVVCRCAPASTCRPSGVCSGRGYAPVAGRAVPTARPRTGLGPTAVGRAATGRRGRCGLPLWFSSPSGSSSTTVVRVHAALITPRSSATRRGPSSFTSGAGAAARSRSAVATGCAPGSGSLT